MPKITISNLGQKVVDFNIINGSPLSLLALLQENDLDWMHACGGNGRCTTCRFTILQGKDNLAATTDAENDYLKAGRLLTSQRLACQAIPVGDIEIEVPEKCKLPGVNYTN